MLWYVLGFGYPIGVGLMIAFYSYGLQSVKVTTAQEQVRVVAFDPEAAACLIGTTIVLLLARYLIAIPLVVVIGFAVLAFWARIEVRVGPEQTLIDRRCAAVRWRHVNMASNAVEMVVDGWGDFIDPETLKLQWISGKTKQELDLGWTTRDAKDLGERHAAMFNAGVGLVLGSRTRGEPKTSELT
jgi:hypothetical protein